MLTTLACNGSCCLDTPCPASTQHAVKPCTCTSLLLVTATLQPLLGQSAAGASKLEAFDLLQLDVVDGQSKLADSKL